MSFDRIDKMYKSISSPQNLSIEKRWVEHLEPEENNNYKFDEWRNKKVKKRQEKLRLIKQKIFNVWTLKFFVFLFIGHCIGDFYQAVQKSRFNAAVVSQCKSTHRKKLFIGVMTTPDYLLTRGAAIRDTWLKEIDENAATVQFFSAQVDGFEGLVTTLDVDDHIYPPQEKSFRLLSYFGRLADEYEWFLRIDDDSIIQWEALSRFLSKIDSSKYQMIGSPGFGRNADDYVPADKAYCMGGPGIIFSSSLVRDIRPHVPACTKKILTDHEDIELCRCIWEKLDVDCTKSWEMNEIFHNNWKKHVEPGEIGYRSNFAITDDLDEAKIHKAVTLHASKSSDNARLVRQRLLQSRIIDLNAHIASLQPFTREVYHLKELDDIIFRRIDGWGRRWGKTYDGVFGPLVEKIPKTLNSAFSNVAEELVYFGFSNEVLAGIAKDSRNNIKHVYTKRISEKPMVREPFEINSAHERFTRPLTIIVPVYGRAATLYRFLADFRHFASRDAAMRLIVAATEEEKYEIASYIEEKMTSEFHSGQIMTVSCRNPFSRGDCLNKGIQALSYDDDLFFISDVDLYLTEALFKRIRFFTDENSLFFPAFFSQYEISENTRGISETNGFWRVFSYGMVSTSKKFFLQSQRFNDEMVGWGGEDTEFANECAKNNMTLMRAHDPDLFHQWHAKYCDETSEEQRQSCVITKMSNKMSTVELAKLYLLPNDFPIIIE